LVKELEITIKKLEEESKTCLKLKKEWEEYRTTTTNALQQLLEQISKD